MEQKKRSRKTVAGSSYLKHLEGLSKISHAITSDLYLEDILKLIVTVTAETMGSKICSLMLIDRDTNELVVRATQSISDEYIKKPNIKLGMGIAGKVVAEGKPISVPDVRKDERYLSRDIAKKENLCSLLCVPLCVKGSIIGAFNLYTDKPHKFTEQEKTLLQTVANQAAVAIENTELLVKSKVIQEELESRKQVERAKDILAETEHVSAKEAFRMMQKQSMNSRVPMRKIAEAIIMANELKKKA